MSKIYKKYLELKSKNSNENLVYLFKSGIFFIFVDNDAKIMSNLLHLKICNLNDKIIKCGFPTSQLEKYLSFIKLTGYEVQIIDSDFTYTSSNYLYNESLKDLACYVNSIDIDSLSVGEAYELLSTIKNKFDAVERSITSNE